MSVDLGRFTEVVLVDFEFRAAPGERPDPICMIAHELHSGRRHRLFREELRSLRTAPYPTGSDTLFVGFFSSAEFGCHLALD